MIASNCNTKKTSNRKRSLMTYTWRIFSLWTLILIGLLIYDLITLSQVTKELAAIEAHTHIQRDISFRSWAANHGGLYVPITEETMPNPYLSHISEREIDTPLGKNLTLMNPAWAIRQLNEHFIEAFGVAGHLTSLKPIRPENGPDSWERLALEQFEEGAITFKEFTKVGNSPFLRLMEPIITEDGCLKCHAQQGYVVGDIRGGISVSIPMDTYLDKEKQASAKHILSFIILWVLGFGIIIQSSRMLKKKSIDRDYIFQQLKESHNLLESRVKQRTSELARSNQKLQEEMTEHKLAKEEVHVQLLEKEIILRETHHRIKNNFASVVSLLSLQAQSSVNPEAISALQDATGRVNSMRVLYEKLLLTDDYQVTSINEYLTNLIDDITNLFTNDDIIVEKQIDDFKLNSKQLIPIGIIVNELLTNIMKYAFNERGSGRIEIILKENQGKVVLTIQDDGRGLPEGFDISESEGFGLMLIKMLSQQLDGTFIIENNNGTKSTIEFVI